MKGRSPLADVLIMLFSSCSLADDEPLHKVITNKRQAREEKTEGSSFEWQ
jgi:hypothetical protein